MTVPGATGWYPAYGGNVLQQQQQTMALAPAGPAQLAWAQAGVQAAQVAADPWSLQLAPTAFQGQYAAPSWSHSTAPTSAVVSTSVQLGAAEATSFSERAASMDPALAFLVQQLEIDPSELDDFGWIAEYGLQESVMPQQWSVHRDSATGLVYYVDRETQVSTWDNPLAPCLRRVVDTGRLFLQEPSDDLVEEQKVLLWHHLKEELDSWHGPFKDDDGRSYFVNSAMGISSWEDPRLKTQYLYDLEIGLLDSLKEFLQSSCQSDPPTLESPLFGSTIVDKPRKLGGAEVLTLEDGSPKNKSLTEEELERQSTLEKMGSAAEWLHETTVTEREVQRRQMMKKAQARRQRKLQEHVS